MHDEPSPTAQAARIYFERGLPPIPLPARLKGPPPEGLTGYGGIDLSATDIAAEPWLGNIGIRAPRDVLGIDVDAYRGGLDTLHDLTRKLGPLPRTWIAHSGRNDQSGIRLFRIPAGFSWIASRAGIDIIQHDHRYVVVAPSIHPEGRAYAWWDQSIAAPAETIPHVDDLPELPWSWVSELSRPSPGDVSAHPSAVDAHAARMFIDAHPAGQAQGYATVIDHHFRDQVAAGFSRHDSMQHCLTWAMEHVAAGALAAQPTIDVLAQAWMEAMVREPRRGLINSDARTTEFQAMLRHAIGKAQAKTAAELHKLHDDVVGITMEVTTLRAVPDAPEQVIDVYQDSIFIDWRAFAQRNTIPRDWLVEDFWPSGRAMALWAKAKEGKSEFALWCAAKLAMGEHPWTGAPCAPVDVAYFDFEMTEDDLEDRLDAFGFDVDRLEHLHYALLPPLHALDEAKGGAELIAWIERVNARAVVIDTFTGAVIGGENDADTVRAFTRHTGLALKQRGIPYLRTDHAGKGPATAPRGTSAKQQDVDVTWRMKRTGTGVKLVSQSRLSWVEPELDIERSIEPKTECVSYTRPTKIRQTPQGTLAKAAELDRIGLPLDAGRPAAVAALKGAGLEPGRYTVLSAALRHRRERAGTVAGTARIPGSGTADGNSGGNSPSEGIDLFDDQGE